MIALSLDAERRAGHVRGLLHGILFMVTENIATEDRIDTTAGSWALLGSMVPRDAHVVAKLREAGALLRGVATLSEWADMRSNNYSEGSSARGGQCRSAYHLTANSGGSSSGSAVGVAVNVFPFALGTETDGSVINPAERNAIVGFQATVGLTSRAVHVLDAIDGPDARDNYTSAQVGQAPAEGYAQFLTDKIALHDATMGIPRDSSWVYASDEQLEVLLLMIELIKSAGATIVNNTELLDYEKIVSPDGWNWTYGTTRGYPRKSGRWMSLWTTIMPTMAAKAATRGHWAFQLSTLGKTASWPVSRRKVS